MSGFKLPMPLAVTLWVGSALAVMGYTLLAYQETANGLESGGLAIAEHSAFMVNPLVASATILAANEVGSAKKVHREKFNHSREH